MKKIQDLSEIQDLLEALDLTGSPFLEFFEFLQKPRMRDTQGSLAAVKLIHSSELCDLPQFKRYQDYNGITYEEYQVRAEHVQKLRRRVARYMKAHDRLKNINHDGMVVYDTIWLDVPDSSIWSRRRIRLTREQLPATQLTCSAGTIDGDSVIVPAGFSEKRVMVEYSRPSNVHHKDEIIGLKETLSAMNEEECQIFAEVSESPFCHPILFISHRWESVDHPDPEGRQLQKLRQLKDCFIIYDYSSFPQKPTSAKEDAQLDLILHHMDQLMKRVIVLESPDYLERGWCIFEYIISSFSKSIVCDEINNEDFVALREWVVTRPPVTFSSLRDSYESQQRNYINENILKTINRILPTYANSKYTKEADREIVNNLLRRYLKSALPPKKDHVMYNPSWETISWKEEEMKTAFETELKWPLQLTLPIRRFHVEVPSTIEGAVAKRFATPHLPYWLFIPILSEWANGVDSLSYMLEPFFPIADSFFRSKFFTRADKFVRIAKRTSNILDIFRNKK